MNIQKLDKVGNFYVLSHINRVFHKVKQTWHYKLMFTWFMGHDWKYKTKKGPNKARNTKMFPNLHELNLCQVSYQCVQLETHVRLNIHDNYLLSMFFFLQRSPRGLVVTKERKMIDVSKRKQTLKSSQIKEFAHCLQKVHNT